MTLWGIGILQSVVLLCLGFAANALNTTATTLGQHAVELGKASTKIDSIAAAREASDEAMKNWVRNEIHNNRDRP